MISIRLAIESDVQSLYSFDLIAQKDSERVELILRETTSGNCFVAIADEIVIGYGVLNYTFFLNGSIDMLYIHTDHRRCGAGEALIRHMETVCKTPKLFTSTNLSNVPMQTLLIKLGYIFSGMILNLDDHDPELVYFKRLRS